VVVVVVGVVAGGAVVTGVAAGSLHATSTTVTMATVAMARRSMTESPLWCTGVTVRSVGGFGPEAERVLLAGLFTRDLSVEVTEQPPAVVANTDHVNHQLLGSCTSFEACSHFFETPLHLADQPRQPIIGQF
jgi:hypothetical protein